MWVLVSIVMLVPEKTRRIGIAGILALLVSLLINNIILKNLVARVRPYEVIEGLIPLIRRPRDYSFPSGHTASSFAAAWVFIKIFPGGSGSGAGTGGFDRPVAPVSGGTLSYGCSLRGGQRNRVRVYRHVDGKGSI